MGKWPGGSGAGGARLKSLQGQHLEGALLGDAVVTLDFMVTLLWFSCSPSPCPTVPKGSGVGIGVLPPRAACHQQDVSHQGRAGAQSSGGAAPGYLPNEGPGAIKICSKQSLPFPGTFQKKKKNDNNKKKKEQKTQQ